MTRLLPVSDAFRFRFRLTSCEGRWKCLTTKLTQGDKMDSRGSGNAHEGYDGVCSLEDEGPVPPSNVTALGKEGRQKEGRQKEGRQKEGRQKEGRQTEGRQKEGRQTEGRQKEGRQKEGRQKEGRQKEGRQKEGRQT